MKVVVKCRSCADLESSVGDRGWGYPDNSFVKSPTYFTQSVVQAVIIVPTHFTQSVVQAVIIVPFTRLCPFNR